MRNNPEMKICRRKKLENKIDKNEAKKKKKMDQEHYEKTN